MSPNPLRQILAGLFIAAALIALFQYLGSSQSAPTSPSGKISNPTQHPFYKDYVFANSDKVIEIGTQPTWVPGGLETEVMRRDAILKFELARLGMTARFVPFLKGPDQNAFMARGEVEVGTGGDMPGFALCASTQTLIPVQADLNFVALVAMENQSLRDLRGRKIGYPHGSNAHYMLLQSLALEGMSENDVRLIPMNVNKLAEALGKGQIQAFAAWEPTPSIAAKEIGAKTIRRMLSSGYTWFRKDFAENHPEAVRLIVASQIRALNWLHESRENRIRASRWGLETWKRIFLRPAPLTPEEFADILEVSLHNLSGVPVIPARDLAPEGRASKLTEFLKGLGKIDPAISWEEIRKCLDRDIALGVMSDPVKYRLYDPSISDHPAPVRESE